MTAMFSTRLPWHGSPNPWSRALARERAAGRPLLDLTVSNPLAVGLPAPRAALRQALANAGAERYTPTPAGWRPAREAVARYYAERARPVPAADVLLCASTSEAYAWLFKLLADPGDRILAPQPSYPLFADLAGLEGVKLQPYRCVHVNGAWQLDRDSLTRALLPSVRAILLVNPNNPTGAGVSPADREFLAGRARPLIVDEVFADYADDGTFAGSLAGWHGVPNFILSGLSKVCGLPNLKLGWIVVQGPPAWRRAARQRLEWIADTYLSVASPVQHALPRLLALGAGRRAALRARLATNRAALTASGLPILPSAGGWYALLRCPPAWTDERLAVHLLRRHGVLVHPGFFYDFAEGDNFLVISLLPRPAVFRAGVARLRAALG